MAYKKEKIHSVKYNFVMNFILTASNFIFPLISFPYVSRVLHAAGNGKINFAASVANYFLMVASLGIPIYGVKACAKVREDKISLSKTAQEILIINLVATVLVTSTYVICVLTVPQFNQERTLFFIEGINIILNMFGANWLYQALEKYDYIAFRSILFKLVSVILMFLLIHQQSDYKIYAFITVFAAVGSNVLNFLRLYKYISFKKSGIYNFKQHIKPIVILFAQNVTISIYTNLDTVMLGFMKGNNEVGLYTAAVKIKGILLSIVSSLGNVMLPRMAYYVQKGNEAKFNDLMNKALNAVLFMALPLCVYFFCESKDSILFLAGDDYLGAVNAMQIITFSIIPNALTGVLGIQVLTPLNKEKIVLQSVIVGASSDFLLNLFMIPVWGAAGAALATTIAEFLVLAVQLVLGRNIISSAAKDIRYRLFRYSYFSIIALVPTVLIKFLPLTNSFLILLLTAIMFFGMYATVLFFSKDEFFYEIINNKITGKLIRK